MEIWSKWSWKTPDPSTYKNIIVCSVHYSIFQNFCLCLTSFVFLFWFTELPVALNLACVFTMNFCVSYGKSVEMCALVIYLFPVMTIWNKLEFQGRRVCDDVVSETWLCEDVGLFHIWLLKWQFTYNTLAFISAQSMIFKSSQHFLFKFCQCFHSNYFNLCTH